MFLLTYFVLSQTVSFLCDCFPLFVNSEAFPFEFVNCFGGKMHLNIRRKKYMYALYINLSNCEDQFTIGLLVGPSIKLKLKNINKITRITETLAFCVRPITHHKKMSNSSRVSHMYVQFNFDERLLMSSQLLLAMLACSFYFY